MLLGAALGFAIGVTTVDKPFTGLLIGLGVGALVGLGSPEGPYEAVGNSAASAARAP